MECINVLALRMGAMRSFDLYMLHKTIAPRMHFKDTVLFLTSFEQYFNNTWSLY